MDFVCSPGELLDALRSASNANKLQVELHVNQENSLEIREHVKETEKPRTLAIVKVLCRAPGSAIYVNLPRLQTAIEDARRMGASMIRVAKIVDEPKLKKQLHIYDGNDPKSEKGRLSWIEIYWERPFDPNT